MKKIKNRSLQVLIVVVAFTIIVLLESTYCIIDGDEENVRERILRGEKIGIGYAIEDESCDERYEGGCSFYLCFEGTKVQGIGSLIRGVVDARVSKEGEIIVTLGIDARLAEPVSTAVGHLNPAGDVRGW